MHTEPIENIEIFTEKVHYIIHVCKRYVFIRVCYCERWFYEVYLSLCLFRNSYTSATHLPFGLKMQV